MIEINLRNKNRIVTLSIPGKAPIRARAGSLYFHNSMELICTALGACFGGELVKFCSHNNINPSVFESINVTMENFVPKIILQHPKDMSKEHLNDIRLMAKNCPVSKMLTRGTDLELTENTLPVEVLVDETKRSGCCGS